VRSGQHVSPYTVKTVGQRPPKGWALFIAMHGGGGAPQELNDSQWRHMQIYYRDHPEVDGYRYLALRAPNNEWNGFYTSYIYPLIANLIEQFLLFGDVDPDKVGRVFAGRRCYALEKLETVIADLQIPILVLTARPEGLQEVVDRGVKAGVRSFLNFVPKTLTVPDGCFVEHIDISAKLEKLSFLSRQDEGQMETAI